MPIYLLTDDDYFASSAQTLVNTVNCVGIMGKGIALEFKTRYPDMFIKYKNLCDQRLLDIGKLWLYKTDNKWILNFPTKIHWRYDSEIIFIEKGLDKFVRTYKSKGIKSVAFPLLGSSNGRIDPQLSLNVMQGFLRDCDIPVYIYLKNFHGTI